MAKTKNSQDGFFGRSSIPSIGLNAHVPRRPASDVPACDGSRIFAVSNE